MSTTDLQITGLSPRVEEVTRVSRAQRAEARPHGAPAPTSEVDDQKVAVPPTTPPTQAELEEAVARVNQHAQVSQQTLQFEVDEDLGRTVVKLVDKKTGEIVRQIPSEEFLAIAKRLKKDGKAPAGLLFEMEV